MWQLTFLFLNLYFIRQHDIALYNISMNKSDRDYQPITVSSKHADIIHPALLLVLRLLSIP